MSDLLRPKRLFILLMLISFASISAVLFTPGLPQLARDFGVSKKAAQWTMSLFLVGYAGGQLPYGPIANRFGRKKAIYLGITLATLGSLLAFAATAFWVLCLARLIQAIGAAVGLKIAFTMIGDRHPGIGAARVLSLLTLAFGIMPCIGVALGGFLTVYWGWRGCFVFLALYSLLLGLLCTFLPETATQLDKKALQIRKIAQNYGRQFKNPFTTLHALLTGLSTALIYIFAAVAPYLAIERIGLTPDQYGLWGLIPSIGLILGTLFSSKFAEKIKPRTGILSGILIILLGTVAMGIGFSFFSVTSPILFLSMLIILAGDNFIWINASSHGLSGSSDKSNGSAVMQFINMGVACLGTFFISAFPPTAILLIPISFGIVVFFMLLIWLKLRNIPKSPSLN